jgi:hypothetical protein
MAYTVGECKRISYSVSIPVLESHINALGLVVWANSSQGKPFDDNVGKCLEVLEDALHNRTYVWE